MVEYDRYWGEKYGVKKVAYDTYEVSGVQGYLAKYDSTWKDEPSIIMAIWVARGGYGYAAFFEVLKAHANDPTLKEALLRSLASFALKP